MREAVQPIVLAIPQDALERIITDVCDADPRLTAAAAKIDRAQFARDMMECPVIFRTMMQFGSSATAKIRRQQLERIRHASAKLHGLLKHALSDQWLNSELSEGLLGKLQASSGGLLGGRQPPFITTLVDRTKEGGRSLTGLFANLEAIARIKPVYPVYITTGMSAFEGFAGIYLPRLFKKYFGTGATRKRNPYGDGCVEGSAIAFASAVMRELHITKRNGSAYKHEAISKAMTLARQKKRRRRSK